MSAGKRGLRNRVLRVEWAAALALSACLATLAGFGHRIAWASAGDTLGWMLAAAPATGALGIALRGLYLYADGAELRRYFAQLRRGAWWLGWARLWIACWVTSYAYFWLKVYVPRLNAAQYDAALGRLDEILHLGVAPTAAAVALLGSPGVASALDSWYALWLASIVWCLAFFAADTDERNRRGVVLSCVLLWAAGSWLYVLVPVVGPAFTFPEVFAGVGTHLPRAVAAQTALWENYQRVLEGVGPAAFHHTMGIGALPSLHVGFHVLFTLWARVAAPLLFWPFVLATGVTFAGSLVTGWHYAVDGYVGAGLAAACFALARRLEAGAPMSHAPTGRDAGLDPDATPEDESQKTPSR